MINNVQIMLPACRGRQSHPRVFDPAQIFLFSQAGRENLQNAPKRATEAETCLCTALELRGSGVPIGMPVGAWDLGCSPSRGAQGDRFRRGEAGTGQLQPGERGREGWKMLPRRRAAPASRNSGMDGQTGHKRSRTPRFSLHST